MTNRNPFTLVELLTTITILAVLAGIALGVTKLVFTKAHESKNRAVIKMIEIALEQYKTKYGYYPNSGETPVRFILDRVDLTIDPSTIGSSPSELDKKTRVLSNNIWQFFDESFKKTYVKQIPTSDSNVFYGYVIDAKGNPLIYRCPGLFNTSSFDLGSAGEDGCLGDGGVQINSNKEIEAITASEYEKFGQGDDIVNFTNNLQ